MLIHPQLDPVAFTLGPLSIQWYGLMYVLAFAGFLFPIVALKRASFEYKAFALNTFDLKPLQKACWLKAQPLKAPKHTD